MCYRLDNHRIALYPSPLKKWELAVASNLTSLVDRRTTICKKLMADMRNESHPVSFLALQVMARPIPYQLRSRNTKATTTTKRTKRANDFFTFKFS